MRLVTKVNSPLCHSSVHAIPNVEFRKKLLKQIKWLKFEYQT